MEKKEKAIKYVCQEYGTMNNFSFFPFYLEELVSCKCPFDIVIKVNTDLSRDCLLIYKYFLYRCQ